MSDVCKVCGNKGGHEDWCDIEEYEYNQELRRLAQAVVDATEHKQRYAQYGGVYIGKLDALAAHLDGGVET